jgi:ribosomal protein S18 acetylase RimI-like enzyme
MFVAMMDGLPIGTVSIGGDKSAEDPDALYLFALDVASAHRGRGIGTAMIAEVENVARSRGLKYVTLGVGIDNSAAKRLYERLGFSQTGEPVWEGWTEYADDGTPIMRGDTCAPMRKRVA